MGEFVVLNEKSIYAIKKFIEENINTCFFMQQGIYGSEGNLKEKFEETIKYYGYIENNNLEGLIFINKSNVMFPYFKGNEPYKKLDLLKILKYHSPSIIRGELEIIEKIFKVIERVLPLYDSKNCTLMKCEHANLIDYDSNLFCAGKDLEFKDAVEFLISAEMEFSRNPLSINQLKNKILNDGNGLEYFFELDTNNLAAQGRIEYSTPKYVLIGGIYTKKQYRGKGCGKRMSAYITDVVIKSGKIPALIVEDDNIVAIKIYEDIGFLKIQQYRELILKKI